MILILCREGCLLKRTTSPSFMCRSTMSPYFKLLETLSLSANDRASAKDPKREEEIGDKEEISGEDKKRIVGDKKRVGGVVR